MGKLAQQLGGQSQVDVCKCKSPKAPSKAPAKAMKCGGTVKKGKK